MRTPSPTVVTSTCRVVLENDLPDLDPVRRDVVTAFVAERLTALPGPMRLGVSVVALVVAAIHSVAGDRSLVKLSSISLPIVGEYFRLLRSLSYAYVWETWPDASPSGAVSSIPS